MYTLNLLDVAQFDLSKAAQFVEVWSQYYDDSVTVFESEERIDYFSELNLGNDLTEENVRRLLRWKDEHRLTHIHREIRQENLKVRTVLNGLGEINQFRNGGSTEDDMRLVTQKVFPTGIVWKAFLLHICKAAHLPDCRRKRLPGILATHGP
ncbi:MAG: hypothetical protein WB660_31780 [Candidatus Sulfotelmatobacter sp.]